MNHYHDFDKPYPPLQYTTIKFKVDMAVGDTITHFRINEAHDWIPAPTMVGAQNRQPRLALMDAELWNKADVTAKYALLLVNFDVKRLRLAMEKRRQQKRADGVVVSRYSLDYSTHEGFVIVETELTDFQIEALFYQYLADYPLIVEDRPGDEQLELFGMPLVLAPALV